MEALRLKNMLRRGWCAGVLDVLSCGRFRSDLCCLVVACLLACRCMPAQGQQPVKAKSARDGVMDQLRLQDGTALLGMAIAEMPPQLLVRTAWLQAKYPELVAARIQP